MRIKVLMVGDNPVALAADIQLLRDKHFLVYTGFDTNNLDSLIEEIHPDLIFIDPQHSNSPLTEIYNALVNNALIDAPVIYTLAEDDLYLVTRKKGSSKDKRKMIADNIQAAVKLALHYDEPNRIKTNYSGHPVRIPSYMHRA